MKLIGPATAFLALAGVLVVGTAAAEPPPPPPVPLGSGPPPPPRGPSVHVDREPDRSLRFDLHCTEGEPTRACADIALDLIGKLNADVQVK